MIVDLTNLILGSFGLIFHVFLTAMKKISQLYDKTLTIVYFFNLVKKNL